MTICAYRYCQHEVPSSRFGRPKKFCSDAHKAAEYRARRKDPEPDEWVSAATGEAGEAELVHSQADTDSQVVAVVHEAIMLRNSAARLGREARPELAVRCESLAADLGASLSRNFRGAISDGTR